MSKQTVNWELNLVPTKVFPIHLPSLWFVTVFILLIRGKKYHVASICSSIMSCGSYTTNITAVQKPNCFGQPFGMNVIFLLTDLTLHCIQCSLDFSAKRHTSFYFSLWLMSFYFISFLATCSLDHPFLLLPDLWLCPQHIGCHQCTRLSWHNSGLPPPAGKSLDVHKPLGALREKNSASALFVLYF